jgi:hypothetical protein
VLKLTVTQKNLRDLDATYISQLDYEITAIKVTLNQK